MSMPEVPSGKLQVLAGGAFWHIEDAGTLRYVCCKPPTLRLVSAQSNISWICVTAWPPSGATSPPDMMA